LAASVTFYIHFIFVHLSKYLLMDIYLRLQQDKEKGNITQQQYKEALVAIKFQKKRSPDSRSKLQQKIPGANTFVR